MSDRTSESLPIGISFPIVVGRARERERLLHHLEQSVCGRGRLVLVQGHAGVGKTTLVADLVRSATGRGVGAVTGHCYDQTIVRPYGPWIEVQRGFDALAGRSALDDSRVELAVEGAGDVDRSVAPSQLAIFERFLENLTRASQEQPLCVVLEDIHWSDPSSLDLLRFIGRQVVRLPILMVATCRDDELTSDVPLFQRLPHLVREANTDRLTIQPLDESGITELVTQRYTLPEVDAGRLVDALLDLTQGNTLYITELLRSLEEARVLRHGDDGWRFGKLARIQVPPLLHGVIEGRLERLSATARSALAVAAVIGHEVPLDLWAAVCQLDDIELIDVADEAIEAGVLDEGTTIDRLTFHHALVREVLLGSLNAPRRRIWHQRIAEAYATSDRPEPNRVAHHFQQARDARAVDWLIEAGKQAQRSHAWIEAAGHFAVAARWLEGDEGRRRDFGWVLFWSAILRRFDDPQHGHSALQSVARTATQVNDPLLRFLATFYSGYLRFQFGDMRRGVMESIEACKDVDALLRAGGFDNYPVPPIALVDPSGSIENHRRAAIDLADQPDHPICLSWGTVLTIVPWLGQIAEGIEIGEALASLWPPLPERARSMPDFGGNTGSGWADLHNGLGIAYAMAGRLDEADRSFAAARALYQSIDHRMLVGEVHTQELELILLRFRTDRLDERRYLLKQITATYSQVADTFTADINLALVSATAWLTLIEGRWSDLDDAIQVFATSELTVSWWRMKLGAVLACLARYRGDSDAAWRIIRELLPQGAATELGAFALFDVTMLQSLACQLQLDAGNLAGARPWIDAHDRWIAWSGVVSGRAQAQLLWASYLGLQGDVDAADDHARRAFELASAPRQPLALIAAQRCRGEIALTAGRHDVALERLDEALLLATACAAPYERALTMLALAELCRATSRNAEALVLLDDVRAICAPLGASRALIRADALITDLTGGVRAAVGSAAEDLPVRLTPRELEVLRLIAAGNSNKEIGEALFLSVRTVERHITNLYFKIGAADRTEATAFAQRHHLT